MCLKKFTSGLALVGFTAAFGLLGCEREPVEDEGILETDQVETDQELYEERAPLEPRTGTTLDFKRYDANGDGMLSQQEFERIHQDWDLDDDGNLTEDEFLF